MESERLVDILPASAKRLRLVGGLSNEEAMAMLGVMVELKDKRIPNLSEYLLRRCRSFIRDFEYV